MFTYGYIREATMAHLDVDETEAQAINLLSRFHIYANEAMQAICASKPMYKYLDITVVKKFAPLVMSGAFFRPATAEEIRMHDAWEGDPTSNPVIYANEEQTKVYYHERYIYEIGEKVSASDTFISFANKQAYKIFVKPLSVNEELEAEAFGKTCEHKVIRTYAKEDYDFSYISKNQVKFYKEGRYLIPARYMWYRFDSGLGDDEELDMPSDILLTIPLYIAAICLQIDNIQKAQLMRQEFELALARCTAMDFLPLNEVLKDW